MRFISLVLAVAALSGCEEKKPSLPGEYAATGAVIATVAGSEVHQDLVDVMLKRLPEQQRQQLEQAGQIGQIKEQVVLTEVLYQEALKQNLHLEQDVQTSIAFAARSAMADALVSREVEKRINAERIQQYYNEHLVQYAKPQAKLSHIVLSEEETANSVAEQAKGGADFAALATANSIDPRTKATGGALGEWVPLSQIQGEIGDALKNAKAGEVVGPLSMGPGMWSVIRIDERRDQVPLAEVEDQIRASLDREVTEEYIKELQEKAQIVDSEAPAAPAGGASIVPNAPTGPAPTAPAPAAPAGGAGHP